ncbi:MAG: diguanylate cyclase [Nitrospinae bacterium]|nr:diguanylate cyclase [Nitrospinota bacterium]MBI3815530.1 diguanylate cyclase [Nitrospinota bacterium]
MKRGTNILIVGAGKGGASLLPILCEDKKVKLLGVVDKDANAPGIKLAKRLKIPVASDYKEIIQKERSALILNLTGKPDVSKDIRGMSGFNGEVIDGESAKFIWNMLKEREKKEKDFRRNIMEQEALNEIGVMLLSAIKIDELLDAILKSALEKTGSPAGSIAMIDEEKNDMYLAAVRGFSPKFSTVARWKIRDSGMTLYIINHRNPVVISDISKEPAFHNPVILSEGIMAIMAIPLVANDKICGILYIDDFKPRKFTVREVKFLRLMAVNATLAIEKARLMEKIEQMAITDELTGLYNHRFFVKSLEEEIERARRYNHHLSLMMSDIDHFKKYNDTYGHLKGDQVLKMVSGVLKEHTRKGDIVARYGGEEFAKVFVETEKGEAVNAVERMREAVEKFRLDLDETGLGSTVTISIGIASFPGDAENMNDLIEKADNALYKAKGEGRNRVCVA